MPTNPLQAKLTPYVEAIKRSAAAGDHNAQQVISTYNMYAWSTGDPAAPALCESFFDDWLRAYKENKLTALETDLAMINGEVA